MATIRITQRIRIPIKWTFTCICRRQYAVRKGTVIRCLCGRVWRF